MSEVTGGRAYPGGTRPPPYLAAAAEDLYQSLLLLHIVLDAYPETYQNDLYQCSAARQQVVEALGLAEGKARR